MSNNSETVLEETWWDDGNISRMETGKNRQISMCLEKNILGGFGGRAGTWVKKKENKGLLRDKTSMRSGE